MIMKRNGMSAVLGCGLAALLLSDATVAVSAGKAEQAIETPSLDLVFIADTSATMVGKGKGVNIFPQVKSTMKDLVDSCKSGDRVVLISYDADVHVYPTITIDDEESKETLKHQIDQLQAEGLWTYTTAAVERALAEADRLESSADTSMRTTVLLLVTDGLDDPPQGSKPSALNIQEVVKPYAGKPWFVWQIQLGPRIDEGVAQAFREAGFANYEDAKAGVEDLEHVRNHIVQRIAPPEAGDATPESAPVVSVLPQPGSAHANGPGSLRVLAGLAGIAAVVAAIAGFWMWSHVHPYPSGTLRYWKSGQSPREYDFAKSRRRRHRIGEPGADLPLEGVTHGIAYIGAERIGGEILPVVQPADGLRVTFKGSTVNRLELHDRDEFQFAGYEVQYFGEVSGRF